MTSRVYQGLLIGSTIACCWLGMMAVHEFGHVLHAWLSGGTVEQVVLHPLTISRTDVRPNPHPAFVTWGGAIWGCLIPLALWMAMRVLAPSYVFLAKFFAGFCLIANGLYWAAGSAYPVGDAVDLLRHGTARWQLLAFGIPTTAAGLWLWNGVGRDFGLGAPAGRVHRQAAAGMAVVFVAIVIAELIFSRS